MSTGRTHDCQQGRHCTCTTPCRQQGDSLDRYREHDPVVPWDYDGFAIAVILVVLIAYWVAT